MGCGCKKKTTEKQTTRPQVTKEEVEKQIQVVINKYNKIKK